MCEIIGFKYKRTRRITKFTSYQDLVELFEGDCLIAYWRTFTAEGAKLSNWPRVRGQVVANTLTWVSKKS